MPYKPVQRLPNIGWYNDAACLTRTTREQAPVTKRYTALKYRTVVKLNPMVFIITGIDDCHSISVPLGCVIPWPAVIYSTRKVCKTLNALLNALLPHSNDEQGYRALLSYTYGHFVSFKPRCGSFRQYYRRAKELLCHNNSYYVYCITWGGNSAIFCARKQIP